MPFNPEVPQEASQPEKALQTESQEVIELKEEFAEEIEKPHEGSYLKKLQRIAGAFILAGITVFGSEKTAISPELSEEFLEVSKYSIPEDIKLEGKIDLYRRTLHAISEEGGIKISPQVETVYKVFSDDTRGRAGEKARSHGIPYFSKPEVILGHKFIKENPEKAKEYLKKIELGLGATLIIQNEESFGSGVIIDSGDRKIFLTNAHVVGKALRHKVGLISGIAYEMRTSFVDEEKDLAILEFPQFMGDPETMNSAQTEKMKDKILQENGTSSLEIAESSELSSLKKGEKLAVLGNPRRFPFEAFIDSFEEKGNEQVKFDSIIYKADPRFTLLSQFFSAGEGFSKKGETLPGMSGGPVIGLDRPGRAKLFGINAFGISSLSDFPEIVSLKERAGIKVKKKEWERRGGAVSADEIRNFINKYKDVISFKSEY